VLPISFGSVTIVDPVPTLLSGPAVTQDINRLATLGRPVAGVVADGVAEIVLRIPANQAGEHFSFSVINDRKLPSVSTDEDGGLETIGGTAFQSSTPVLAVSTTTGHAPQGIVGMDRGTPLARLLLRSPSCHPPTPKHALVLN
jgi:hypothetical protein